MPYHNHTIEYTPILTKNNQIIVYYILLYRAILTGSSKYPQLKSNLDIFVLLEKIFKNDREAINMYSSHLTDILSEVIVEILT